MRRLALTAAALLTLIVAATAVAQEGLRLHVQPAVSELPGDGDATTTVTITARDPEGNLVDRDGTVAVRINAGRLSAPHVPMRHGIAEALLTAPILDDEPKVFQRGIEATIAVLQSVSALAPSKVTGVRGRARVLEAARDAARRAPSAAGMTTVRGENPEVRIVAQLGELKGKASVAVKAVGGARASGLRPGLYEGRDVTGSSRWTLELSAGGPGFTGVMTADGDELSFRSRGETKAGFVIVYLYDPRELRMLEKGNSSFLGWPTAVKPLPGDMLYMLAPPVYLTRVGDLRSSGGGGAAAPEPQEAERVSLVARRNLLPGDGTSRTELVLRYLDARGRPVAGARLEASMMRGGMGGRLVAAAKRTDGSGLARFVYQAPELLTDDIQRLGSCKRDPVRVDYHGPGKESGRVQADIGVLYCTRAVLTARKPGFDEWRSEVLVASPRGTVRGRLFAEVRRATGAHEIEKHPVADADVRLAGGALRRIAEYLEVRSGEDGSFTVQLPMKNWEYAWNHALKPQRLTFTKLHVKRRESLADKLYRFQDKDFEERARKRLHDLELGLCADEKRLAEVHEERFQLLGDLMATLWMADTFVADTGGEVVSQGWSFFGVVVSWANGKYKLTKSIDDRLASSNKELEQAIGLRNKLGGGGVKLIIYRKLRDVFGYMGMKGGRNQTLIIMDESNSYLFGLLRSILSDLAGVLSQRASLPSNPMPELITDYMRLRFLRDAQPEIERLLAADPEVVADGFAAAQAKTTGASGALRAHYQNIAAWRLTAEEAMAVKALVQDVGFAAVLTVGVVTSGGAATAQAVQAWEKYKKISEGIDKAFALGGLALEIRNLVTLEAESLELFRLVNQRVAPGAPAPRQAAAAPWEGVAWAAEVAAAGPPPPPTTALTADKGRVPWDGLAAIIRWRAEWSAWEMAQGGTLWRSGATEPARFADLAAGERELDEAVLLLKVLAADSRDGVLSADAATRWNDAAATATGAVSRVADAGRLLHRRALKLPSLDAPVRGHGPDVALVAGGAALVLGLLLGVGLVTLRLVRGRATPPARDTTPPVAPDSAPVQARRPRVLLPGGGEVALTGTTATVGAASSCDVVLPWRGVNPVHARLCRSDVGTWWVEAAEDGLPLEVNGATGPSFWLEHGWRIRLGTAELVFLDNGASRGAHGTMA